MPIRLLARRTFVILLGIRLLIALDTGRAVRRAAGPRQSAGRVSAATAIQAPHPGTREGGNFSINTQCSAETESLVHWYTALKVWITIQKSVSQLSH